MRQFARTMGFQLLVAGAFILAFPNAAIRLAQLRAELANLSPSALRLIGGLELLTGVLLVWLTTTPAAGERVGEITLPERRRVA